MSGCGTDRAPALRDPGARPRDPSSCVQVHGTWLGERCVAVRSGSLDALDVSGSLLNLKSTCSSHPALNCLVSVSPEEYQQIYSSWEMASGISVFGMLGSTTDTVQTYDIVAFEDIHNSIRGNGLRILRGCMPCSHAPRRKRRHCWRQMPSSVSLRTRGRRVHGQCWVHHEPFGPIH